MPKDSGTMGAPTLNSAFDSESQITLDVLTAVDGNSAVTQRSIAQELGIALGLANAYLKRCSKKGLIKITSAPANRYAYYLTPQGFAEKSRLTARYLSQSFNLFRHSRNQYEELFDNCVRHGWRRIALAGASDLAEIALLCSVNRDVLIVGLIGAAPAAAMPVGVSVVGHVNDLAPVDAVIVTDMTAPQDIYDALVNVVPRERVLAPRFLNISRNKSQAPEKGES